jgi:hypothetical protein
MFNVRILRLFQEQAVTISRCGDTVSVATGSVDEADLLADWLVSLGAAPGPITQRLWPRENCGCGKCTDERISNEANADVFMGRTHMILCPSCGNKRCPYARDHKYECTGSNASGQIPTERF